MEQNYYSTIKNWKGITNIIKKFKKYNLGKVNKYLLIKIKVGCDFSCLIFDELNDKKNKINIRP